MFLAKCLDYAYAISGGGTKVDCSVMNKTIADGDRERDCPYFHPII